MVGETRRKIGASAFRLSGSGLTTLASHCAWYSAGVRINSTVYYVLKDRLGSAYATTDASGNVVGEMRYYASGETRLSTGTMFTDKLFTGQREMAGLGIYQFGARFYSPKLGRFISADSIVPGYSNPQLLNRYSYVNNNPLRYTDPTGHMAWEGDGGGGTTTGGGDDWWNDDAGSGGSGTTNTGGGDGGDTDEDVVTPLGVTTTETFNSSPDYYILSGIIPVYPSLPIFGIALSLTVDRYGNVYFAGGLGIGLPVTVSGGAGWFLAPENDNESFAESFLQRHSFTVSGGGSPLGVGPGIGVNNNYPSYSHLGNDGATIENIAVEGLITSPGGSGAGTYGFLIYDHSDNTPWIWQGD